MSFGRLSCRLAGCLTGRLQVVVWRLAGGSAEATPPPKLTLTRVCPVVLLRRYGDIVATPLHGWEQAICVTMMLTGSLLYAYLVGSFCGLAANLSPDVLRFRQDLTDLNKFLSAHRVPAGLAYQLREYMHQTLYLRHAATGNRMLTQLASKLRNEVALTIHEKWLFKIELLHEDCEEGLILELAFALRLQIFPPGDSCPVGHLYIVSRGSALFAGRAYLAGTSWGEADALLTSDYLRFPIPASAISYLFSYSIDGDTLRQTMSQKKYPDAAVRLRYRQVKWIVRRGIVRKAEEHLAAQNEVHLRLRARGAPLAQKAAACSRSMWPQHVAKARGCSTRPQQATAATAHRSIPICCRGTIV